jgi:hypothetical protein
MVDRVKGVLATPLVYERPEWEASGSLLEMNGTAVIRRFNLMEEPRRSPFVILG